MPSGPQATVVVPEGPFLALLDPSTPELRGKEMFALMCLPYLTVNMWPPVVPVCLEALFSETVAPTGLKLPVCRPGYTQILSIILSVPNLEMR